MSEELNYSQDLYIDPDGLDVEWVRQAELFMQYSEALSDARLEMEKEKERLDVVKAEADLEIRSKYEKKPPESQVSAEVVLHPKVRGVEESLRQTRHYYDSLLGAVRAMDQKKTALENLVKLAGQGYYAAPTTGERNLHEQVEKLKSNSRKSVKEKTKERRSGRRKGE